MKYDQRVTRILGKAAGPTLAAIRADGQRASAELRPLFPVIERRIFDESFTSAALWRESGVNRNHAALFHDKLGLAPWAYISARRLDVGGVLLSTTRLKIWKIAQLLGYNGPSAFSKAWRRVYGDTPKSRRQTPSKSAGKASELARILVTVGDRRELFEAEVALRAKTLEETAPILALTCHERGAARAARSDVDEAFQDLSLARGAYALTKEFPVELTPQRRMLTIGSDTTDALRTAFCPKCRETLHTIRSFGLRTALGSALSPVSRDLAWFRSCCDPCYRLVWEAISRSRLGLEQNAWKAWWLSESVDLQDPGAPPSRGRIIAALDKVERGTFGDQQERKKYCDLAVADAVALGDALLEAQARIWRGSVLRAMGELSDARSEFARAAPFIEVTPWLGALHARMAGILADHANQYSKALDFLRSATKLYEILDMHTAGLMLVQQANVHFFQAEYEKSVAINREALLFLDGRRDPLPGNAAVPIHVAVSLGCLKQWAEAELALSECHFDRELEPGASAGEVFTRACLQLGRGRSRESLSLFAEAKALFEKLHQPLNVALVASYSVEAYSNLGDRAGSLRSAAAAFRFFGAARCPQDTLNAVGKLRALLEAEVIDAMAVAARVRSVALKHGGWLPVPDAA